MMSLTKMYIVAKTNSKFRQIKTFLPLCQSKIPRCVRILGKLITAVTLKVNFKAQNNFYVHMANSFSSIFVNPFSVFIYYTEH